MPRKSPLSSADLEVARRINELRKLYRLSREDWARRAGQSQELIARIELGRVPLLFRHAAALLPHLSRHGDRVEPFNPLWMADGSSPMRLDWPFLLPSPEDLGVSGDIRFVDFVGANRSILEGLIRFPPQGQIPESWLAPYLHHWAKLLKKLDWFSTGVALVGAVFQSSAEQLAPTSVVAAQSLAAFHDLIAEESFPPEFTHKSLPSISDNSKSPPVKSEMESLLADVRDLTAPVGSKVKLAAELEVEPARITEWLSGKYQPNGETTLRLLHWVAREKEQQKRPGSDINTAKAKAQRGRKYEQPNTSGPPKR